jgi:predicted transcriptional regulator
MEIPVMKQNITLTVDKEIIRKSKVLAAKKDTSVSKLLADSLTRVVENEESYEAAKRNGLHRLRKGFRLGGAGIWKREELYDR